MNFSSIFLGGLGGILVLFPYQYARISQIRDTEAPVFVIRYGIHPYQPVFANSVPWDITVELVID